MALYKKIFKPMYFILGIIIGIILLFLYPIEKKIVTIYPNEKNKKDVQYKDLINNCYEANIETVKCPNNPLNVKVIPIQ